MAAETIAADAVAHGADLARVVALLGAAVIAVPIFKRLGLGSVLGYLAAGLAIGPFGIGLFTDPEAILQVAEFGVVMLLFVIGLELKPSRLWGLRQDIFGLGLAQVLLCAALIGGAGILLGMPADAAIVAAMGLALSSTAIVMQVLEERHETAQPHGRKTFSILLLQDLAIVPLLGAVAFLAPGGAIEGGPSGLVQVATAAAAIAGVVFAARYVLNPLFAVLAATRAREIMTAAALLVVLGAAFAMQAGGLSMGLGAFLAGVVLSESSFRHQLEADIEPFRGLLLGLFFLSVGMSLDLQVVAGAWLTILGATVGFMVLKGIGIYAVARLFRSGHRDAVRIALLLAQGGEFAFVLYTAAADAHVIAGDLPALLSAVVILSMALTPLALLFLDRLAPPEGASLDGVPLPDGETGAALIIGFGRFGQVVSQALLARGVDVTIIDADPERIRNAASFGFKIYYGDGTRLDVLRAAGAGSAKVVCVCTDKREASSRIVELAQSEFPLARLHVRSFDRGHSLELRARGVTFEVRETVYSALALGEASLRGLGFTAEEAAETTAEVRRRDIERLRLQEMEGSLSAGRDLVFRAPVPTPLVPVRRGSQALSEETAMVAGEADGGGTGRDVVAAEPR